MLHLDSHIKLDEDTIFSPNLVSRFSDIDLGRIGAHCLDGYKRDEQSRLHWMKRNEAGMDLALQIQKDKSFPWPGCSSIAFPLVTVAAMQFHARAYPAIVNGSEIVKYRVVGDDPDGAFRAHADKVSTHMSWQLLEEDTSWEEQEDRLLFNLSIIGTCFKKIYYSPTKGHNISEMVLAKDLVINYWAKSVDDCGRKTHIIPMSRNEIYEKVMRGLFRDCLEEGWYQTNPVVKHGEKQARADNRQGVRPPMSDEETDFHLLEQHCDLDLDGDGYSEPYIVTLEEQTGYVTRIVTRFDSEKALERVDSGKHKGAILQIRPTEYFEKYTFIPSPDGGMYDIGFGVFLGPLNESVNSLVNQLIDAGTMANTAGGFLARGAKIRGGVYQFSPFGWNRVDSTGDDLRKSIYPLPVRDPSPVLFELLNLLIQYTNRIAGTTETMVGENPGQNTPASTTQTMVEMGQKVYAAIFKRIWRASKNEFAKLYALNALHLPVQGQLANREDYLLPASNVVPAADPNITSDHMILQQALMLREAAGMVPGYDREAVERRFLKAIHIDSVDTLYPGIKKTGPLPNPKMALIQVKEKDLELKQAMFAQELQEEIKLNNAKITELMAKASLEMETAGGIKEGHRIAAFEAAIGAMKLHSDHMHKQVDHFLHAAEIHQTGEIAQQKQISQQPGSST